MQIFQDSMKKIIEVKRPKESLEHLILQISAFDLKLLRVLCTPVQRLGAA
jgi:hypothetical protein